jgi:multidrug efflux pump subunit AcrA (membrane-fusion protein)
MTFTVGQPGFVEAFEQTSIFSKVSGFIKKFAVDIGDQAKEGQVLCEIVVPELEQEHQQKLAQVRLDGNMVEQAEQLVNLAQAKINMASAETKEAEANVGRYQAQVVRWESELKRMTQMVVEKVIDRQSLAETRKEFESSKSAWDASRAAVVAREAAKLFAQADLKKARIDVETAKSKVKVSEAEERRLTALLEYTKITAPYDGVVTVRNANTGDYVESVSGDKTSSGHVPMFVVARTDLARIFVDVPEQYARSVEAGTKAVVCAEALSGQAIPATVARTSWSLNQKTRSLRAEIDLPTKQNGIRPGMYVYAKVFVERPAVRAVLQDALIVLGNQTYALIRQNGRVVKTPVECGITDGTWEEVVKKKVGDSWQALTGNEEFIVGDLSEMTDG